MTLEIITAPELQPFRHGFFTRKGGASSGVFEGLNCGAGSSDQMDVVAINRARVAEALDAAPEALIGLAQVHSATAVRAESVGAGAPPRADALVTATPGLVLTVLTADCAPVLLADEEARVVGAAHAGWKGALGGVVEAVLAEMEALGARRERIAAVIGPTISQRAYEVGPEFFERFADEDQGHLRFFVAGAGNRYHFDLPGFVLARLRDAGVGEARWTAHCTYTDESRFFSYRRSVHRREADYGRLIAAIAL